MNKIIGKVIHGNADGTKLGFPTANIQIPDNFDFDFGVYASYVIYNNQKYLAVTHCGPRKVFNETTPQLEVHILGFELNIYGEVLEIEFVKKIRETIKFESVERLVRQIKEDVLVAEEILNG